MTNLDAKIDETGCYHLDVRKLLCPLPVIRVQQVIQKLKPSNRVRVTATDPGVLHDIPTWCRIHGHRILETQQLNREIIIEIEILA
jgi:tRNA 2-thiouridine synthesizing protein A